MLLDWIESLHGGPSGERSAIMRRNPRKAMAAWLDCVDLITRDSLHVFWLGWNFRPAWQSHGQVKRI
jgi:hypothetical protein